MTSSRRVRVGRFSAAVLAVALTGGVLAACTPQTTPPSTSQAFCNFYNKVAENQADQSTDPNAVLVKDQVVAVADPADTTVAGSSCTDANAKVSLDDATLAEGTEVPSEENNADSTKVAAITGDQISAGEPVLDNLKVTALSAEIGPSGITVRGNVQVRLSGATSSIGFVGTLSNLDNWSVNLSSSGFTIPGITSTPVVFNGTLVVSNGIPSLTLTASATSAKIGDVAVNGATIKLMASPATGVSAAVTGAIKVGPSTASGTVNVDFDKAGALVNAHADIAAHLVGTQAGGKKIDLTGSVKIDGNKNETAISFNGHGIVGDLLVNEANGDLTLATNKATFVGVLDVAQGPNTVRFNGSIVWDGVTAYTPFLTLQGAGEFSGTMQDGSTVTAKGTIDTTIIGGQVHAELTGDFKIGTLKAVGSAVIDTNGATTTLNVDANLQGAGFAAKLDGVIIITDGLTEQVELNALVNGSVNLGDVTLTGANLHISSSYGSPLALQFSGGLKVGDKANLTGSVDATFGPNGTLLSLTGNMIGSLNLDTWGLLNFSGKVVASSEQVSVSGSGAITMINFPLGITFNGTFTSSLTNPSWSLNGSGKLAIAGLNIASARLSLTQGVGMKSTHTGFYFSIIGIPTYFEADFYMKPTGGCSKVIITGGSFLAKPILKLVLPGVVGCPVD